MYNTQLINANTGQRMNKSWCCLHQGGRPFQALLLLGVSESACYGSCSVVCLFEKRKMQERGAITHRIEGAFSIMVAYLSRQLVKFIMSCFIMEGESGK